MFAPEQAAIKRLAGYAGPQIGVDLGKVSPVAKARCQMPMPELEKLLDSRYYEARHGCRGYHVFPSSRQDCAEQP